MTPLSIRYLNLGTRIFKTNHLEINNRTHIDYLNLTI